MLCNVLLSTTNQDTFGRMQCALTKPMSREKSSQVAIMGDIFHLARRVLVWLGLGGEHAAHFFDLLRILSSRTENYGVDAALVDTMEQQWDMTRADKKQELLLDKVPYEYDFTGMDEFYTSPWFRRL